eukprot:m.35364 g.35364  ORF g.35364 m.35364 type:complete len:380 (-) comp6598_c0_seq1:437-1576(-)
MVWQPPRANTCKVCAKAVFYMEKVVADEQVYHKTCFKCTQCKKTLSTGTYASLDGKLFCKPHFKQLFKLKGRYNFAKDGEEKNAPSSVHVTVPKNLHIIPAASSQNCSNINNLNNNNLNNNNKDGLESAPRSRRESTKMIAAHAKFAKLASSKDNSASLFLPSNKFGLCTTAIKPPQEQPKQLHFQSVPSQSSRANIHLATNDKHPIQFTPVDEGERRRNSKWFVVKGSSTNRCPPKAVAGTVMNIRSLFESHTIEPLATPTSVGRRRSSINKSLNCALSGNGEETTELEDTQNSNQTRAQNLSEIEDKNVSRRSSGIPVATTSTEKRKSIFSRSGSSATIVKPKKSVLSAVAMFEKMVQSAHVGVNTLKPRHVRVVTK